MLFKKSVVEQAPRAEWTEAQAAVGPCLVSGFCSSTRGFRHTASFSDSLTVATLRFAWIATTNSPGVFPPSHRPCWAHHKKR